ncbi:MAG TPA: papain-like cysteine protease family protein [Candidatus Acidoferrales bacterium]|nr:papain-like cysteine protease family protein [Candidatus Acidoferrales bacterium]
MGWAPNWVGVSGGVAAPGTSVTSIARYPQHLDAFCVGTDNGIYSTWWDIATAASGWAKWFKVAGGVAAPGTTITVVARNPNHLDLFAVGSDHGIYSIWWDANGGWASSWFRISHLTAAPGTSVAAIARNPNHLDLFVVGADMKIYSIWWDANGGWAASWFNVSGGVAAPGTSITALTRSSNHIDLFAVGSDHRIYSTWWDINGGWASWFNIAGGAAAANTSIAAVARYPTHMDLFAVGTDHRIYSIWWDANGGWASSWFNVSGGIAAPNTSVSVVSRYPNHLDVFAVGTDHGIDSTWWDASTGWAGWFRIAGGIAAPSTSINALSRYPDILDVFVVGTDHHVDTIWWLDELYFTMQHQQQSNWCWAATATSVALFYEPASGWTQCTVANDELGRSDCCGTGASGPCNVYGFLDQALTVVGRFDRWVSGSATTSEIETEVTFARPLGIRVAWSGGGAHFLCIMGQYNVGGVDYVTVDDPIYGRSDVTYTTLQTAYQGSGTWTHTYYTKY